MCVCVLPWLVFLGESIANSIINEFFVRCLQPVCVLWPATFWQLISITNMQSARSKMPRPPPSPPPAVHTPPTPLPLLLMPSFCCALIAVSVALIASRSTGVSCRPSRLSANADRLFICHQVCMCVGVCVGVYLYLCLTVFYTWLNSLSVLSLSSGLIIFVAFSWVISANPLRSLAPLLPLLPLIHPLFLVAIDINCIYLFIASAAFVAAASTIAISLEIKLIRFTKRLWPGVLNTSIRWSCQNCSFNQIIRFA